MKSLICCAKQSVGLISLHLVRFFLPHHFVKIKMLSFICIKPAVEQLLSNNCQTDTKLSHNGLVLLSNL